MTGCKFFCRKLWGGNFSIFRKVLNPLNWKCMKKLLLSVVAAFCITASPAQSFEELLAPVHSCCERGNRAMEAKRYAEAEREYREAIRLFETLPDSVRTQLDEWNYGGYLRGEYYNLACAQSRLNKRRAAVASLAAYVDCGNCDYSWMIEDPDLDNIRSERGYAETVEKLVSRAISCGSCGRRGLTIPLRRRILFPGSAMPIPTTAIWCGCGSIST